VNEFGSFFSRLKAKTVRCLRASWLTGFCLALALWRQALPERSFDDVGYHAIADTAFAFFLSIAFIAISIGMGIWILHACLRGEIAYGEMLVLGFAIGAGIMGTLIGIIGICISCSPAIIQVEIILMSLVAGPVLANEWRRQSENFSRWRKSVFRAHAGQKALWISAGCIILLCLIRAAAPPWDPDGLTYHLEAPREFLAAGRIIPLPMNAPANYPMVLETVYMAGMAFGSDSVARIMHVTWFAVLLAGSFFFARRFFGGRIAWMTVIILLGIPILPYWSTLAYADLGWAGFEFFSLYALCIAWDLRDKPYAILPAGLLAGCAAGSKYLAAGTVVLLAVSLFLAALRQRNLPRLRQTGLFLLTAGIIALPWYLKNFINFGNPVFPLTLGIFPADPGVKIWQAFVQNGFGVGRSLLDYLLLPINLYLRHGAFATVGGTIEFPSLFFPLVLLIPFIRPNGLVRHLGFFTVFRFAFWAMSAQEIRLLVPLFPLMAILSAVVILWIGKRMREGLSFRVISRSLMYGLLSVSMLYQLFDVVETAPWRPVLGMESKGVWLSGMVNEYRALRYIEDKLPRDARVMLLWDGRGYYCDSRCVPDTLHSQWTLRVDGNPAPKELAAQLKAEGFTHILYSASDMTFLLLHDPDEKQAAAWDYFRDAFQPDCATPVYTDALARVYRIDCP
jgi:hypothetical protein